MDKKVDILHIGAHAGDEVATGLALAHAVGRGRSVALLHLTPGEKGHPTMAPEDYAALKREEAAAVGRILGDAPVYWLPYRDGELPVSEEVKFGIADVIRACRPDVILTHWHKSIHKDHTNAVLNVPDALFYAAIRGFERADPPHYARRVLYGENWEDNEGFEPEVFLEVTPDDLALYEAAMRCYALFRGEWKTFAYLDYYKALARVRGLEVYTEYAVAFAVPPRANRRKVTSLA